MNEHVLTLAYTVFPGLPYFCGVGAYFLPRKSPRWLLWLPALLVAALVVGFVTAATRPALLSVPLWRVVATWTALYALPVILALTAVDGLRRTRLPWWIGTVVVIGVCAGAQYVASHLPFAFLDIVEATS